MLRTLLRWAAAALYIAAGTSHFLRPALYVKIVPPFVPAPLAMVYISGIAEIAGGAGLLLLPFRRAAAIGLIVLLLAVFPANIYMAIENIQVTSMPVPVWLLWARLPIQFLLIWWLWLIRE